MDPVLRALRAGEVDEADTGELTHLVPDGGTEGLDPERARFRLYDAVCRFVRARAAERPLVLVVDDLHWADPASLQLLRVVATDLVSSPLLVVATYRDTEATSPDLLAALADLDRAGATRVELSGLGPPEVAELVSRSSGEIPSGPLLEALVDRTGGNPFFVVQLVKLLEREDQGTALADELPRGVRA